MMSQEHKKCPKKGACKKEFCKKAENDNAGKNPDPKPDACTPEKDGAGCCTPKKGDAGCCTPKKDGKKGCGNGCDCGG